MDIDPSLRYASRSTIAALVLALATVATAALTAESDVDYSASGPANSIAAIAARGTARP